MDESQDSAAFTAECVTVGPSRAEHVQQVLSAARATLARCRVNEIRERPAEPPGVLERSRGRPHASRDRTPPTPRLDTQIPTWEQIDSRIMARIVEALTEEREDILEVIRALRELGEALDTRLTNVEVQMDEVRTTLARASNVNVCGSLNRPVAGM